MTAIDGYKVKLASAIAALAVALQTIDFSADTPKQIALKLLLAFAGGLLGWGAADKMGKHTSALNRQTDAIIAASPAVSPGAPTLSLDAAEAAIVAAIPSLKAKLDAFAPKS
jgi:hypothetical protein